MGGKKVAAKEMKNGDHEDQIIRYGWDSIEGLLAILPTITGVDGR